jgi:hypothetical protein
MVNISPPSPTTYLGKILAAGRKLASLSLVQGLLRMVPGLPAAALAGVVIMFFAWSCEHQARQRDIEAAKQVKKQADEQISQLQQQAAGALRDAKQSTQAALELEAQRQQFVREAEGLRQSLESLRQQELARANEVATLPTSTVASRVASRLQEQVTGNREQGTGQLPFDPLTRPAPADESAGAGHPLPQGGEGQINAGGEGQGGPGGEGRYNPGGQGQQRPAAGDAEKQPAPGVQPLAANASSASSPALVLSDQGARKVETALIELDSCRQQAQVMGQQVSNCEQQAKLDSALEQQQSATISKLNAAVADKDQILARSEDAHRAELKAARGTWGSRFFRAVEIFAGGFIAGVLVR